MLTLRSGLRVTSNPEKTDEVVLMAEQMGACTKSGLVGSIFTSRKNKGDDMKRNKCKDVNRMVHGPFSQQMGCGVVQHSGKLLKNFQSMKEEFGFSEQRPPMVFSP